MAKYLEVTIRIPIREQYQEDTLTIQNMPKAVEPCYVEGLDIEAGFSFTDDLYEQLQDSPLISSLAHIKSAEVVDIEGPVPEE